MVADLNSTNFTVPNEWYVLSPNLMEGFEGRVGVSMLKTSLIDFKDEEPMTVRGVLLSTHKSGMNLMSSEIESSFTSTLFQPINIWEEAVSCGEI